MDIENKGVEVNETVAPSAQEGVETTRPPAPQDDPEARIAALIAENDKLTRDRDNYRSATLALKGKTEAEDLDLTDPVQAAAFVQKQIQEGLANTRASQVEEDLKSYAKKLAKDNKELALALANKQGFVSAGQGAGESANSETKREYFSKDQLADLKKRGWSDEKIKSLEKKLAQSG